MRLSSPQELFFLLVTLSTLLPLTASKETKLQRLTTLAVKSKGPIILTDKSYEDLTSAPRNYTTVILLTALDKRFNCEFCWQFQPEFELLTKSWLKKHPDSNALFFGSLDFLDGRATFQRLGLTNAPVLYVFPPTYGPHAKPEYETTPIVYDFPNTPKHAETLASWLTQQTQYSNIPITRPINYARLITITSILIIVLTIVKVTLPYLLPIIQHPTLWAAISLVLILLFTSGHMFNHIRKTPYVVQGHNGGISYIAGGFSNQYGMESQIVGVLYAFLSFGTISIAMKVPRMTDPNRQKVSVVAWCCLILFFFSFLMNLFTVKNPSYPFKLPPVM